MDEDGDEAKRPVVLHRAIFGSMERFLGMLIEDRAGHLPLVAERPCRWSSRPSRPTSNGYAEEAARGDAGGGPARAQADLRNEKVGYKVREHSSAKVPVIAVVGAREAEDRQVSRCGGWARRQTQNAMGLDEAARGARARRRCRRTCAAVVASGR